MRYWVAWELQTSLYYRYQSGITGNFITKSWTHYVLVWFYSKKDAHVFWANTTCWWCWCLTWWKNILAKLSKIVKWGTVHSQRCRHCVMKMRWGHEIVLIFEFCLVELSIIRKYLNFETSISMIITHYSVLCGRIIDMSMGRTLRCSQQQYEKWNSVLQPSS